MESRWYVPRGKRLETTKIEDREHALHICRDNWGKILKHLDRNDDAEKALAEEEERKRKMKEESYNMTKNWPNSVENIHKRQEEERWQRIEAGYDRNAKIFVEITQKQEAERQAFVDQMKRKMFEKKDACGTLNGALMECEAAYQRQRQVELNEKIAEHQKEVDARYYEVMKKDAEQYNDEIAHKATTELKKNRAYREELKKQVRSLKVAEEKERKEKLEEELQDHIYAAKEMEELEANLRKKEEKKILRARREMDEFTKEKAMLNQKTKEEEKELEDVIQVISLAKDRVACIMRAKYEELRDKKEKAISDMVMKEQDRLKERDAKEDAIFQKGRAEIMAREDKKEADRQAVRARLRQQRIDDYKEHRQLEEKRKYEQQEVKKWDMLNRFKTEEEFKRQEAEEARAKAAAKAAQAVPEKLVQIDETVKKDEVAADEVKDLKTEKENSEESLDPSEDRREKLLSHVEQKRVTMQMELQALDPKNLTQNKTVDKKHCLDEKALGVEYLKDLTEKEKKDDDDFFEYANEVLDYAKSRGRITYPIEKVIQNYRVKTMGERPAPRKCQHEADCPKKGMVNNTPGKMVHCRFSDPTYVLCKCRCHKNTLYN